MDGSLHPRVRTDGLALAAFDGELLVQDPLRSRAHALNPQAAAIFRLADGSHTVEEIAALASVKLHETVTLEAVWYALGLLQRLHLLEERVVSKEERITRKVLLQRAGAALALASIASITVPAAGAHASACLPNGVTCNPAATMNQCCSGTCACSRFTYTTFTSHCFGYRCAI